MCKYIAVVVQLVCCTGGWHRYYMVRRARGATAMVGARYGVVVVVARASTWLSTDRGFGGDVGDVVFVVCTRASVRCVHLRAQQRVFNSFL